MTAHQMLCHVADAFRMATGAKAVSHDVTWFNRTVLKWGALHLPWPPGVFATRPELDALGGGTPPTDFASDLTRVESELESFVGFGARLGARPHPLFGPMSEKDWMRWGWLHTDHHLRQFGA